MRKSDLHRVYTYTYNESPMSKELERGQIKTTVVLLLITTYDASSVKPGSDLIPYFEFAALSLNYT